MGRGKRALAAVAILAVLAAASIAAAPRAAAEGGELRGDLPVAGGFALVSWSGGPAEALAEAARSRGCNVDAVYANAPGGGIVGYFPAAQVAAANREFLAAYSGGLPASPVYVACGEPALPRIVFLGDVSEERRAAIRDEVASVVRFYAERFGVVVPESTLYAASDGDTTATAYRELTGQEYPLSTWQNGGVVTDTPDAGILAFVSGRFVRESRPDELARVLAHEYYHMIQRDILRAGGSSYRPPEWLTEGTARYVGVLYNTTHCGCQWGIDFQTTWDIAPLHWEASFRDITENFGIQHYDIAASAIHWLVDKTGNPRSHIEYWRALASESDWRSAFVSVFELQADEFFDAFEMYRAGLHRKLSYIRGKVFDLEETPLAGVHVAVNADHAGDFYVTTDESGVFEVAVPEGRYGLWLIGGQSSIYRLLANVVSGYANACEGPRVSVGRTGVNVEIKVWPELLKRLVEPPCNEGRPGFRMINGTVHTPSGTRLTPGEYGYQYGMDLVAVCLERDVGLRWEHVRCMFDGDIRDQAFIFYVGEGSYRLMLKHLRDYGVLGEGWYADGGITTEPDHATAFEVTDADITGIEVRLPDRWIPRSAPVE